MRMMSEDQDCKYKFHQFDGSDFDNWKYRVEILLEEHDLLECLDKRDDSLYEILENDTSKERKEKVASLEKRITKERKCKSLIVQRIANSHLEYVKDKKLPNEIWDTLTSTFARKGIAKQIFLRRKLMSLKLKENISLSSHFLDFDRTIRELKGCGAKMEEADVICNLFLTLPPSYDTITTALETIPEESLKLDFVKAKLLDEELKRKQRSNIENETNDSVSFPSTSTHKFRCYKCDRPGHFQAQCKFKKPFNDNRNNEKKFVKKDDKKNKNKSASGVSFSAEEIKNNEEQAGAVSSNKLVFLLDSGASVHMVNDISCFSEIHDLQVPVEIAVAKADQTLQAHKEGTIKVESCGQEISITRVLYIKNLNFNLLSVGRIEEAGLRVVFNKGKAVIYTGSEQVAVAKRRNRVYMLEFVHPSPVANLGTAKENFDLWHRRLAHINAQQLSKMSDVLGIKSCNNADLDCRYCIEGKQCKLPHSSKRPPTSRPLELVHSDVCGPVNPTSWDKNKYFLTFVDSYTHFTVVYVIKRKEEVLEKFKEYEAAVTSHFERRISRLRCDNGGEYVSHLFKKFCINKGIKVEYTIPRTPQNNGVAERMNRTLVETARTMLLSCNLGKYLWSEAVQAASYLLNRRLTTALQNKIPADLWYGGKTNFSKIRVFGCEAYLHVPKEQRKKFDSKSKLVYMVGYAPNGYRLWDPIKKTVILGRDIVFKETKDSLSEAKLENQEITGTENSDKNIETTTELERPSELRRSERIVKKPNYSEDYETYFAMSAEELVEDLPKKIKDLEGRPDEEKWREAVKSEMDSLKKNGTWSMVDKPKDRKVMQSRWVFKIKRDADNNPQRYKARLVVKGFLQTPGLDYKETFAPVARLSTCRTLLALANKRDLHLHQMDVKTAFLNGELKEDVYMAQPDGFDDGTGRVCKLVRSLYGLKQAPRCWNERLDNVLKKIGFRRSEVDRCLYIQGEGLESIYLLVFVDDLILASKHISKIEKIKILLKDNFEMEDLGELNYYLGIKIERNQESKEMFLSQKKYLTDLLNRFGMIDCNPTKTPMETNFKSLLLKEKEKEEKEETSYEENELDKPYKQLIGCLMYAMLATRPDLSASVSYLSRFQGCPNQKVWEQGKRVLRYIKGTLDMKLCFKEKEDSQILEGYVDADWGSDPCDRKSTSGYFFSVYGAVVSWTSKKQQTVALSTAEAEYMALSSAACEAMWLKSLLLEFQEPIENPIALYEDNVSAIALAKNPEHHGRTKHIDIRHHFIRELIEKQVVEVHYLAGKDQPADGLTKPLPEPSLIKVRTMLGLSY